MKKFLKVGLALAIVTTINSFNMPIFNNYQIQDVYASDTKLAMDYQFDALGNFREGLAPVLKLENKEYGKYGFIDKTGKLIIGYNFGVEIVDDQTVYSPYFYEGLCAVYNEELGKVGFIDKTGELVIDYQFDSVGIFNEGLCPVYKEELGKVGFIDKTGKLVIPYEFDDAYNFNEDLAAVYNEKLDKYGFIDKTGKLVIDYKFNAITNFKEGLALVCNEDLRKYGFIDKTGKLVIDYKFDYASYFREGLALVYNEELNKFGYIDKTGELIIDYKFDYAGNFKEGLAKVGSLEENIEEMKIGFIDKTGNLVIDYKFDFIESSNYLFEFNEGLASVYNKELDKYAVIDKTGKLVTGYEFDDIYKFEEGLAPVYNKELDKWGVISKESILYGETTNQGTSKISVILDGEKIEFPQEPIIENGYTLVPMRAIFEKLGANVEWDANTKTITATKGETVIKLTVGNNIATVNGKEHKLDVSSKVLNGTTLVPVRFISEQLNVKVDWDANTKTVNMTSK